MLYRLLRIFNAGFPLVLLFMYLCGFVLTMMLVFTFPPGALILFLICLFSLIPAVMMRWVLVPIERRVSRRRLIRGECPWCRDVIVATEDEQVRCSGCGALYEGGGGLIEEDQRTRSAALAALEAGAGGFVE